jgi:aspartate aminotransferase
MKISDRADAINESLTTTFTAIIEKLRKEGKDVIDLAVGEPDLDTPIGIIDATKKALDDKKTKYSVVSGLFELKKNICKRLSEDNLDYSPENILICNGAKQALYTVFQAICDPGDEVIIQIPCWVSFSEQVKLAGGIPVYVNTIDNQLDIKKIKESITKKTKAIVINSPNNPTGAVYKKSDIEAIADIALENDLFVVSDEAYDSLVYDGLKNTSIASLNEEIKKRTFVAKTFSKEFSMTGFRIGYVAAEKEFIRAMNKLQGHITGNVCTFAQHGAISAFDIDRKDIEKRTLIFQKKRDIAYKRARELFECIKPEGAFYLFVNVKNILNDKVKTSAELSALLLEKAHVAVVPGEAFGVPGHIRVSYATSEENIIKGFDRITDTLTELDIL